MIIKKELTSWLAALGDLVFPKSPICIVCNKDIPKTHFLEYPIDLHAEGQVEGQVEGLRHSVEVVFDELTNKATAIQGSSNRRFLEKTRVDMANQLCNHCYQGLKLIRAPLCQQCGRPIADTIAPKHIKRIEEKHCSDCSDNYNKRSFIYARAAVEYNEAMQEMIHLFKYRGRRDMSIPLSVLLCNAFEHHFQSVSIDEIVPVPLHEDRLAERGFNQATQICSRISEKHRIPVADILRRIEYTGKQSKKTKAQRSAPLDHAFTLTETGISKINKKNILLVDDIYTTGTTIDACTNVLMKNGAKEVYALTLAR